MVESSRQTHSRDPYDRFDEAIQDLDAQLYDTRQPGRAVSLQQYEDPEQLQDDPLAYEPVPLFLSNYEDDDEPRQHRFGSGGERNLSRARLWSHILKGGIAAAAAAGIALAIMSMENPLSVFANAKASLGGTTPGQLSATEPALPPQVALVQPAEQPAAPDITTPRRIQPAGLTSVSPSRDEIAAAYQGAAKTKVVEPPAQAAAPAPVPVAPPAPAARRIDPEELAALLKRAKGLLAVGDITSARLLLERAADAQEAEAALMLAGTYDPQVIGTQDMRSISPDPAAARLWYQKAAQLGSVDARRRLQTQN
jgi:TPR repeat protein